MTTLNSRPAVSGIRALAVALIFMAAPGRAMAQTTPTPPAKPAADQAATPDKVVGSAEIGLGNTIDSYKLAEYSGLQKTNHDIYAPLRFDLSSAATYESASAFRWHVVGTDLALDTRAVRGEVSEQGKYRLSFGYNQLRRNRSDSYQTPYENTGTNVLTLPSSWLVPVVAGSSASNNHTTSTSARGLVPSIGGAGYIDTQTGSPTLGMVIPPNAAQLALVNAAAGADVALFHNVNLSTTRTAYDAGVAAELTHTWGFAASIRAEHKDGLKPLGSISRNTGGDISTIIPDLVDTNTEQVNSSLIYKGDKTSAQVAYYGSFFTNHVPSMSWQNWASGPGGGATMNTMSTTPDNTFHQFSGTMRYKLSKTTHLVANASYGRNTQDDPFLTLPSTVVVPVASLNGLVVSTSFDAKITGRAGGKTTFTGFYRFNDRDNQTPVHIFQFADAEEPISPNTNFSASNPLGALLANNANANRPYSRKTNLATLEADYKLAADQSVKGGYAYERNHRWCGGSWIDCADTSITNEHTLKAEWRADFGSRVNARVSYGYGMRRTPSYNENAFLALVPYAGVSPTAATGGATALSFMTDNGWNGWGPALGYAATTGNMNLFFPSNNALANALYVNANRISELQGMRRYYVADRNRNRLRSGLNWQATDAFSLQGGVDFTLDDYTDAKYGLQSSDLWSTSIDGTYAVAEGLTAAAYYNYQHQRGITAGNTYTANSNTSSVNGFTALSGNGCDGYTTLLQRNNNNKLDPCLDWTANMLDQAHTFGFTLAKTADRGDLTADAIYSRAETTNDVTGGSWVNNLLALPGAPAGTIAAYFIPATALPAVTARSIEFRLNARIKVDARQSVRFIYSYLRLSNVDWQYDGMQIGAATLSGVLPTNETAFNDSAHIFAASYVIRF